MTRRFCFWNLQYPDGMRAQHNLIVSQFHMFEHHLFFCFSDDWTVIIFFQNYKNYKIKVTIIIIKIVVLCNLKLPYFLYNIAFLFATNLHVASLNFWMTSSAREAWKFQAEVIIKSSQSTNLPYPSTLLPYLDTYYINQCSVCKTIIKCAEWRKAMEKYPLKRYLGRTPTLAAHRITANSSTMAWIQR